MSVSGSEKTVWLYALRCRDDTLYVGVSKDVAGRFRRHRAGKGSFYTRINRPIEILAAQAFPDRSTAMRAETALKACSAVEKQAWASRWPWPDSD